MAKSGNLTDKSAEFNQQTGLFRIFLISENFWFFFNQVIETEIDGADGNRTRWFNTLMCLGTPWNEDINQIKFWYVSLWKWLESEAGEDIMQKETVI